MSTESQNAAVAGFEPNARDCHLDSLADAAIVSLAISMRRIADCLAGEGGNFNIGAALAMIATPLDTPSEM